MSSKLLSFIMNLLPYALELRLGGYGWAFICLSVRVAGHLKKIQGSMVEKSAVSEGGVYNPQNFDARACIYLEVL